MQLTIEDRPHAVRELLWVREAYDLTVSGDVPPPLVDTPAAATRTISPDDRAQWTDAWPDLWDAVTRHAGLEHDHSLFAKLTQPGLEPAERAELLARFSGPSWRDEFGDEPLADASYRAWEERGMDAHIASRPRALSESPERRDLDALIPAWERGLTKVVTIPCRGEHTRILGPSSMLVTDQTRADSAAYRTALNAFRAE